MSYIDHNIQIISPSTNHGLNIFNKRYNLNCNNSEPVIIDWRKIRKSKWRRSKLLIKCDDCNIEYLKRLCDLDPEIEFHLCKSCNNKGERNSNFGKPMHKNTLNALTAVRSNPNYINPFARPEVIQKLKDTGHYGKHSIGNKYRLGKPHSDETKELIRNNMIQQYVDGRRSHCGLGKVKTKYYKNKMYQSSYELNFLKFCENNNILDKIDRGPKISYICKTDNKKHAYFPDYTIIDTNIIIEIKSSYHWNRVLLRNQSKAEAASKYYKYFLIMDNDFKEFGDYINEQI
jgi:hypothetical protein